MASQAKKATVFSDIASHLFAQLIVQKLPTEFKHLHSLSHKLWLMSARGFSSQKRQELDSRTRLVIRNRIGSAWELEIVALIIANSLVGDARTRGLLECTIRITKQVREPRNEMRQKLAYSNAGVSKVECPECATTRSLDGPLGDSTIPFPPKTKNQDLISKIRILKVLLLLVLLVANWVQVLLEAKLV